MVGNEGFGIDGGTGGETTGGAIEVVGDGRGYTAFNISDICFTPCITGSPSFIPRGDAVE